jgi:copper chaperone CopZ
VTEQWARDALWRTKGVKDVDSNWMIHWVKVTFDDQVTSYDTIVKALAKEGFYVEGEPEWIQ